MSDSINTFGEGEEPEVDERWRYPGLIRYGADRARSTKRYEDPTAYELMNYSLMSWAWRDSESAA